ncbi:hypothetical protein BU14_0209s0018 [Porphyra umbilicalis]|uniref:Protein kinase domain-containing protein n=1 Tax=Porphyra umbilicalis TaxID=2786 RepID=A0A1X6P5I6_PORUM|nr:hypothetical protein BU14_0209s0018 [Porphyra umbilicalis]|eukprot:OSX76026.1 hypothetical protein BU14_0209s0018 [Porphyra umbilicalis]
MTRSGTSTLSGRPSLPSSPYADLTDPEVLACSFTDDALLGKGTFGKVYHCRFFDGDAAVKVVPDVKMSRPYKTTNGRVAKKQLEREGRRLSNFRSPYITQYLGAAYDGHSRLSLLVMERMMGGSLQSSLAKAREANAPLHPKTFFLIAKHIALGLQYLHKRGIGHGDIKPANILLTEPLNVPFRCGLDGRATLSRNAVVKLADFGMSLRADQSGRLIDSIGVSAEQGIQGTLAYLAPEGFWGGKLTSFDAAKAMDIYAMGIVLYGLLSGCEPWGGYNAHTLRQAMSNENDITSPIWPNRFGPQAASVMPEAAPPAVRPGMSRLDNAFGPSVQAVATPTIADLTDGRGDHHRSSLCFGLENVRAIVERCWAQDPADRPSARELVTFFCREDDDCVERDWDYGGGGGAGAFLPVDTDGLSKGASVAAPGVTVQAMNTVEAAGLSATAGHGGTYYNEFFEGTPPSATNETGGTLDAPVATGIDTPGEQPVASRGLRCSGATERPEAVDTLVTASAAVHTNSASSETTLYLANLIGRVAVAAVRVAVDADEHAGSHGGETGLQRARRIGRAHAAEALLTVGVDMYTQSGSGETAPSRDDRGSNNTGAEASVRRYAFSGSRPPLTAPKSRTRRFSFVRRATTWRPGCIGIRGIHPAEGDAELIEEVE